MRQLYFTNNLYHYYQSNSTPDRKYHRLAGCVHYANAYEYAVMLRRGTEEHWDSFLRAFETFSYFAKLYSKETDLQLNCRRYGYSQPKFVKQYAIFKDWEIPLIYRSKSH